MRLSLVYLALVALVVLTVQVNDGEALFPYAVKGFVRDVRHKPHLFIGAWALKKFLKLKLIKLKFYLFKKLVVKKTIKIGLVLLLLKRLHRRGKREVQDYVPYSPSEMNNNLEYFDYQDLPGKEPSDEEMMAYLQMANEIDTIGCLAKGVCEVVARGNGTQLNHFETMVYDIYGNGAPPTLPQDHPNYQYEYAAYLGKTSRDPRVCEQKYRTCQEQPQKLNQFMERTFASEMCEFPDDQVTSRSDRFFLATAEPPSDFPFDQYQYLQDSSSSGSRRSDYQQFGPAPAVQDRRPGNGNVKFE